MMRISVFLQRWQAFRFLATVGLLVLTAGAFYIALIQEAWGLGPWWAAFGVILLMSGSAWLGWAVRQAWIYPIRLRKAEALWDSGAKAEQVVDLLSKVPLALGELGYRVWLLRSKAHLAMGHRDIAWAESEQAHLVRIPFWLRFFLRRYLRSSSKLSGPELDARARFWLRLAPDSPRLKWHLASQLLSNDHPESRAQAWVLLREALPQASEDPLLLEDLMMALLERIEVTEHGSAPLGRQETDPVLRAVFDRILDLLLHRHGYRRAGWNRLAPAERLLREKRFEDVLFLSRSVSSDQCPAQLWEAVIAAREGLGDREGAWNTVELALQFHLDSFRLWMLRQDLAMELRRYSVALEALGRANALLFRMEPVPEALTWEWNVQRAEYAYWVEKDAEGACAFLEHVPEEIQREGHPSLRFLVLMDLGRYETVHEEVAVLLAKSPGDVDFQIIEAECLMGMEAWESLRRCLDRMGNPARNRADYWHLKGLCRSHLGELLGAREDLERCAYMEPDNPRFVLDAGHACAELGEWERSEHHWRQVLRFDDCNEEALTELAETRRALHDTEGAKRLLRECLLHHPESHLAQSLLAELEAN